MNDLISPTVSLTEPGAGITVSGTVTVTAGALDNVGVSRVEFYVNGLLVCTDTAAPYNFNWDTTTVVDGTAILSAKAYDAAGNVGQTGNVTVTVRQAEAVLALSSWGLLAAVLSLAGMAWAMNLSAARRGISTIIVDTDIATEGGESDHRG